MTGFSDDIAVVTAFDLAVAPRRYGTELFVYDPVFFAEEIEYMNMLRHLGVANSALLSV